MKKLFYVLLGAASAVFVQFIIKRRTQALFEGAPPRPIPVDHLIEDVTAEEEVAGPLAEV